MIQGEKHVSLDSGGNSGSEIRFVLECILPPHLLRHTDALHVKTRDRKDLV